MIFHSDSDKSARFIEDLIRDDDLTNIMEQCTAAEVPQCFTIQAKHLANRTVNLLPAWYVTRFPYPAYQTRSPNFPQFHPGPLHSDDAYTSSATLSWNWGDERLRLISNPAELAALKFLKNISQ